MCTLDGCGNAPELPPIPVSSAERRRFLAGLASLPLATVLSYPDLARAQAASTREQSIVGEDGTRVSGVIALPAITPAPAVLLVHEWWGLNDQIKSVAAELASLGYIAYAIDLYGGEVASTPDGAKTLMVAVDDANATAELSTAIEFLRLHEESSGRVGTVGWCFGGGWSINASLAAPVDATVAYYGRLPQDATALKTLQGPVMGHFGTEDESIDEVMVGGFERAMVSAGHARKLDIHWYTANHAFANPSSARYDEDDAALAWSRTQAFFAQHLQV